MLEGERAGGGHPGGPSLELAGEDSPAAGGVARRQGSSAETHARFLKRKRESRKHVVRNGTQQTGLGAEGQ